MDVRFWGVRGSVAVSGEAYVGTGGNTSCVEVTHDGHRLVLDGGTGLQALGHQLLAEPTGLETTLLFSHVHWDHIQGVPFFGPAFRRGDKLRLAGAPGLREALAVQMTAPQFPVPMEAFQAELDVMELTAGRPVRIGPFEVLPVEMRHPQGVLVYRISAGGRSLVFATDVEHGETLDEGLVELSHDVDLLVHDAQYTRAEYEGLEGPCRRGWGHSTWEQAVDLGRRSGARRTALFHHDPNRTDRQLAVIEAVACQRLPGAFAAREGRVVAL